MNDDDGEGRSSTTRRPRRPARERQRTREPDAPAGDDDAEVSADRGRFLTETTMTTPTVTMGLTIEPNESDYTAVTVRHDGVDVELMQGNGTNMLLSLSQARELADAIEKVCDHLEGK